MLARNAPRNRVARTADVRGWKAKTSYVEKGEPKGSRRNFSSSFAALADLDNEVEEQLPLTNSEGYGQLQAREEGNVRPKWEDKNRGVDKWAGPKKNKDGRKGQENNRVRMDKENDKPSYGETSGEAQMGLETGARTNKNKAGKKTQKERAHVVVEGSMKSLKPIEMGNTIKAVDTTNKETQVFLKGENQTPINGEGNMPIRTELGENDEGMTQVMVESGMGCRPISTQKPNMKKGRNKGGQELIPILQTEMNEKIRGIKDNDREPPDI